MLPLSRSLESEVGQRTLRIASNATRALTLASIRASHLWDVIFDRHRKGPYYRGKFEQSGTLVPAKSLLQDMFAEQKTALILDELQTWYDGLHDEPGAEGKKPRTPRLRRSIKKVVD